MKYKPREAQFCWSSLQSDLDVLRKHYKLSWLGMAQRMGVQQAVFIRMGTGDGVSVDTLVRVLRWSHLKFEDYVLVSA